MKNAESVTFAGGTLDRAAHFRTDADVIAKLRAHADSRWLLLWRNKPLLDLSNQTRLAWLCGDQSVVAGSSCETIFLGLEDGAARFAMTVPDQDISGFQDGGIPFVDNTFQSHPALPTTMAFGDLRANMAALSQADAGNAAVARGIFSWHQSHRFCANCGSPSAIDDAGWRRTCPDCGTQHFPRTDPVVIMLVTHGNSVLLGRSPHWPESMYSLLAGFMEPGESIEAAVRREVFEETGIKTGQVGYLASQPWPFPSSLMIGCRAEALTTDIVLDQVELEDALWLSREDALAAMNGLHPGIAAARKGSIARFLLERWLSDTLGPG